MKVLKKSITLTNIICLLLTIFLPIGVRAESNVDTILASMTNEEKIAQMIMPAFRWDKTNGTSVDITEINDNIESLLNDYGFAGVILFSQNTKSVEQTARLVDSFQLANQAINNRPQLFIAIDQEGGRVNRIPYEIKNIKSANKIANTEDINMVRQSAQIISKILKGFGIIMNYAPVLDIKRFEENHAIGDRCYGGNKEIMIC